MNLQGRVYARCGCREQVTGRRLGSRCPRRGQRGHGSWYLSPEIPAGADGLRRRVRRGGYPAREAARRALTQLNLAAPGRLDAVPVTVGQWLDRWLDQRAGLRESTRRGYASHVRVYLAPHLGRILLAELSASHVQAMFTGITPARRCRAAGHRGDANAGQGDTASGAERRRPGRLPGREPGSARPAAAGSPAARRGLDLRAHPGVGGNRHPAAGSGMDRRADRGVPERGPQPPAVRGLPPDRAAGPAPRRGMRPALARLRPGHRHRRHLRAAAGIRRPPHRRPAQDPEQRAGHRPGPHHGRGAASAPPPAAGRAPAGRSRIPRQRVRLHRPQRRPARSRPADADVQSAGGRGGSAADPAA
jgi:hypothetical protein